MSTSYTKKLESLIKFGFYRYKGALIRVTSNADSKSVGNYPVVCMSNYNSSVLYTNLYSIDGSGILHNVFNISVDFDGSLSISSMENKYDDLVRIAIKKFSLPESFVLYSLETVPTEGK